MFRTKEVNMRNYDLENGKFSGRKLNKSEQEDVWFALKQVAEPLTWETTSSAWDLAIRDERMLARGRQNWRRVPAILPNTPVPPQVHTYRYKVDKGNRFPAHYYATAEEK